MIYYLAMKISLNPRCLISCPKGETLIFQTNDEHASIMVPKRLPWDWLMTSSKWDFKNLKIPEKIGNT